MSDVVTLREVYKAHETHEKRDDDRFAGVNEAMAIHEKRTDDRFASISLTAGRIEAAILEHAKATAAFGERSSVRMHERIDKISAVIEKGNDNADMVSADLHKRINGMLWAVVIGAVSVAGWAGTKILEHIQ